MRCAYCATRAVEPRVKFTHGHRGEPHHAVSQGNGTAVDRALARYGDVRRHHVRVLCAPKIEAGLKAVNEGRTIPHDEAKKRLLGHVD
jgi:predicted transcriptional regulator